MTGATRSTTGQSRCAKRGGASLAWMNPLPPAPVISMHPRQIDPRPILALLGLSATLGAQDPAALAGSESYVALLPALAGGAVSGVSQSYRADFGHNDLEANLLGSESYSLVVGAIHADGALAAGPPVVAGVTELAGTKDGGQTAHVVGFGFADVLAGTTTVDFGSSMTPSVSVLSNTQLQVSTPPGVDLLGNPLGLVDVSVTNQLGAGTAADAYAYLPALIESGEASIAGGALSLSLHSIPGALAVLSYGLSLPGVGVPVAPFDGSLTILVGQVIVPGLEPAPDGIVAWEFPLPDDPALTGATIEFQAAALENLAPLGGSFTNTLPITLLP